MTAPNELCAQLYNRMPVVLNPAAWPAWLGEEPADAPQLKPCSRSTRAEEMVEWPGRPRVGNVKNNDPSLIYPANNHIRIKQERGGKVTRPRAADDFPVIRARMEELRHQRARPRAADDFPMIRARMEELRRERAQLLHSRACRHRPSRGAAQGTE